MKRDRKTSLVRPVMFAVAALLVAVGTATVSTPVAEANTQVCADLDSGKIDTTNEPATVTVTAPDGKLISGYCVKAGTEALYFVVEPPVKTLVIDHPNRNSVSHYALSFVDVCAFDPTLPVDHPDCVPPTTTTTTTTLPPTTTTTTTTLPPTTTTTTTTLPPTTTTTTTLPPTTTTTIVDSNPPEPTLAVEALSPVCIADAPYVEYRLALGGIPFPGSAKLTFRSTLQPDFEDTVIVTELSGRVVYPGATVDTNGNATDWPGWMFENGEWKEDPTDAFLRQGLTVTFEVNPTATATVTYPAATSACAGPPERESFPPPGTAVPVPQPFPQLPATGSDSNTLVQLAGLLLAGGLLVFGATRRRPTRN